MFTKFVQVLLCVVACGSFAFSTSVFAIEEEKMPLDESLSEPMEKVQEKMKIEVQEAQEAQEVQEVQQPEELPEESSRD